MFGEEIPKDLSVKPDMTETEDNITKNNDNNKTDETADEKSEEMMDTSDTNTIDLSVKKKSPESSSVEPDSNVEPIVEPKVESKNEPTIDSKNEPTIESKKEPKIESKIEPIVEQNVEPRVEPKVTPIPDNSDEQPMELTLDLSKNSSVETNGLKQILNQEKAEDITSDIQMLDSEDSKNINENHINGDTDSKMNDQNWEEADDESDLLLPQIKEINGDELRRRQRKMRRLKQELRNEEMKLVLLKKLRQSQLMKENIVTTPLAPPPERLNHNQTTNNNSAPKMMTNNSVSSRNGSHNPPMTAPNLSVGQHSRPTAHNIKSNSVLNPPMRGNPSLAHSGSLGHPLGLVGRSNGSNHMPSAAHSGSLRPNPLSSMNRTPVTTPPNVVLGYPLQDIRGQSNVSNSLLNSHQSLSLGANGSPGPNGPEPTQTPAQRQAAAKLALRKQLEKTLLQIPPPKPPPPEMHFIPNANNQEFVYYLGLETVVDFLTDSPNQNRPPPDPFECVQCGTDFTPVWKWQDRIDPNRDRPAVICETCVTSNIKKALKAEHTNRLKTAFVKALQQEQEIEQRIASGATSPPLPTMSPPSQQTNYNGAHQSVQSSSSVTSSQSLLPPQAPPAHSSMPRLSGSAANAAAAAAAVASSAALLQQMPKLSAAHQSLFAAQAQQLHQLAQSLPQPQPAHMLPFGPLLAAQAYSYGMLGKSGVNSSDLHRQYLLDMIPSRSLPQGSINWKT